MKVSQRILQRGKKFMSLTQMGKILILSDHQNKLKEAMKWMEGPRTRKEAQKYIDAMCDTIDDYARGGRRYR